MRYFNEAMHPSLEAVKMCAFCQQTVGEYQIILKHRQLHPVNCSTIMSNERNISQTFSSIDPVLEV